MTNKAYENNTTREQWLVKSADLIVDTILVPAMEQLNEQYDLENFRVSVGKTQNKKAIGECWKKSASQDNTNEIFITPHIDDSIAVLETLVHELIHAADDCQSGHKNFFARTARKVGLVGKLTATSAGDALKEQLLDIVDVLGNIPHSKLKEHRVVKKQTTRMLKIECTDCGFNFRASMTQLKRMADMTCLCCGAEHGLAKSYVEAVHGGE